MNPSERLYQLLPAIYRLRDYELRDPQSVDPHQDSPLEKFLLAIAQELQLLEGDMGNLYENWYIETCDDWVVPYIGDLVGIPELYAASSETITAGQRPYGIQERRAYVANTIAYRRRKGTASVLEQLARDVTGWGARVVECWDLLALEQNLNHIRTQNKTVNLRSTTESATRRLDFLGTPFESETAYTVQVRPTRGGQGRYNIPDIGIYIWRLSSYPLHSVTARLVENNFSSYLKGRCYSFSPLANSEIQLFNSPQTETEITQLAEEINLPIRLPRRPDFEGYQGKNPVFKVFINGQTDPIPPEEVLITALVKPSKGQEESDEDDWLLPELSSFQPRETPQRTKIVAVDPKSGRIAFLDRTLPQQVKVSYAYGFSGDIGGGAYERGDDLTQLLAMAANGCSLTWEIEQAKSSSTNPLAEAIQSWNGTILAWQGLNNQTCIPLAEVTIDPINIVSLPRESELPPFKAGIIKGLKVIAIPGTTVAVVTPGGAIDGQGRVIDVNYGSSLDLSQMNPNGAPQTAVLIVVSYRAGSDNQTWQFNLIPVQEFLEHRDRYPEDIYLLLTCLVLNQRSEIGTQIDKIEANYAAPRSNTLESTLENLPPLRPPFKPGIFHGLGVLTKPKQAKLFPSTLPDTPPGSLEVIVRPGIAVDGQGRRIVIPRNAKVALKDYQNQKVWLVISYPSRSTQQTYQLQVITEAEAENLERYPETTYLRLAQLAVPTIKLNLSKGNVQSAIEKNSEQPGVIQGLQVSRGENPGEIMVCKGKAIDGQGCSIELKQNYHLDLSNVTGQTLTLFISQQQDLGWQPIKVMAPTNSNEDWRQLGIVPPQPSEEPNVLKQPPQKPQKITKGIIVIRDDATYKKDLAIKIPADGQLKILAANGQRPHILGNISVQGIAAVELPKNEQIIEQGELTLNGLLMEGKLTVEPGNLRWLNMSHCTLVPQQGGLMVNSTLANIDAEEGESWTLIALAIYCLNLISKLFQIGFKSERQSPQKVLTQLNQLAYQEAQRMFLIWQQIVFQEQNSNSNQASILEKCFSGDNSNIMSTDYFNYRLKITILKSICGAVQLTDTIPELEIVDSIIDRGSAIKGSTAIAAPQSQVKIATTTVLGSTIAGNLAARDSIFNEPVTVTRRQQGCVRFCYVPDGSQTPPRYQCQPDLTLKEKLHPSPKAIASLTVEKRLGHLFAGTAGDGIYHSLNQGENWSKIQNREISQQHITSLIAYAGTITSQGTTVTGINTNFTLIFQAGDVIIANNQIKTITNINSNQELTIDNAFEPNLSENKSFFHPYRGQGTISGRETTITGRNTNFTLIFQAGDVIIANNQIKTITNINSNQELIIDSSFSSDLPAKTPFFFTGQTTCIIAGTSSGKVWFSPGRIENWQKINTGSNNTAITELVTYAPVGTGTISSAIVADNIIGDKTAFTTELEVGDTITVAEETKTVREIISDTELKIDRRFSDNLPLGTTFKINRFLAGTSGNGVFSFGQRGQNWRSFNQGLTNLNITALALGKSQPIFVGTAGGVFRFSTSSNSWEAVNYGLTDLQITALAVDESGTIFVGTEVGGVFTSADNGDLWLPVAGSPVNLKITALIAYSIPSIKRLVVATAGGGIFSTTSDRFDQKEIETETETENLSILNIATMVRGNTQEQIFVGTPLGNIFVSQNNGITWINRDRGLVNVEQKLALLAQLQPNFTSEKYGDPGYAQLKQISPTEIATGAEDGSEMGAFSYLKQPQRQQNLDSSLDDYLRFGLEKSIFYVN